MKIIAITGTKGKTSVARMIDFVLVQLKFHTIRVDSDGCFQNSIMTYNRKHSQKVFHNPPTVSAGKYLNYCNRGKVDFAILEQSISSGKPKIGLGYKQHHISVFTNIFDDHIDYKVIKNQQDIFHLKLNILKKAKNFIIVNFDDPFSKRILHGKGQRILYFGTKKAITQEENYLYYQNDLLDIKFLSTKQSCSLDKFEFPISLGFMPSIYNLMAAVGSLLALGFTPDEILNNLANYNADPKLGRLVLIELCGKKIIFDTAHEANSIMEVARLAKSLGKKVIGVLRLSPERVNKSIRNTARILAKSNIFNHIIVYDFIDGIYRSQSLSKPCGKSRAIGETANIFSESLAQNIKKGVRVEKILNEQDALRVAIKKADKGDVIVMIHHKYADNLEMLKKEYGLASF